MLLNGALDAIQAGLLSGENISKIYFSQSNCFYSNLYLILS